eukprot:TRINITY_DN4330_c0_g1_i1.p2 TRINITY_DN4330_c0_g1~~TRINITY_DN4330_c0_g1_i1.p2  ORF type:complete len:86 (+),score=8.97 TRINITY_DN4330_c0_g1_i1:125-382(+)
MARQERQNNGLVIATDATLKSNANCLWKALIKSIESKEEKTVRTPTFPTSPKLARSIEHAITLRDGIKSNDEVSRILMAQHWLEK